MADTMFVKISDIPGSSTEENHKDWIVIQDMFFELERTVDMTDLGSNRRPHTQTEFQKIDVTSQMGIASNLLALSVAKGTVRPEIELHICRPGEDASDGLEAYSIWKLKNAIIDRYSVSSNQGGIPEESWAIAYSGIEHEYREADKNRGRLEKKNVFKWNLINDMMA